MAAFARGIADVSDECQRRADEFPSEQIQRDENGNREYRDDHRIRNQAWQQQVEDLIVAHKVDQRPGRVLCSTRQHQVPPCLNGFSRLQHGPGQPVIDHIRGKYSPDTAQIIDELSIRVSQQHLLIIQYQQPADTDRQA